MNRTENVTYEYTVTPKSHGVTRIPRTHIKYDDKEAFVDADLDLLVESPEEYAKRTDRHIVCYNCLRFPLSLSLVRLSFHICFFF